MSNSNKCAPPARNTSGLQETPNVLIEPGFLPGGTGSVTTVNKDPSARPKRYIFDALQRALSLIPGYTAQITKDGGKSSRESTKNHPSGDAADVQLINSSGTLVTPEGDPAAYTSFISGLVGDSILDNKVCGIGLYSWGIHFDQSGHRQTGSGGVAKWNGWGSTPNPGPPAVLSNGISQGHTRAKDGLYSTSTVPLSDGTSGEIANPAAFEDSEAGKQLSTVCDPAGGGSNPAMPENPGISKLAGGTNTPRLAGGCTPLSPSALGAAKNMLSNEGLGVNLPMTDSLTNLSNSPLMAKFEEAAGLAENLAIPDGLITDVTSQLSNTAFGSFNLANLDKTFSSLTGKLSGPLQSISGLKGSISQGIGGIADQIFSGGNLKDFAETFNKVKGAVGIASNLSSAIEQAPSQIFGDAKNIIGNLSSNIFEEVAGVAIDNLAGGITQTLLGDQEQVLNQLLNDGVKTFAAFGSVYKNFDSMVTQGMGSLTSNVPALGRDLKSLGNLGNMQDLLRVGKPGQVAEQVALSGSTAGVSLIEKMVVKGVSLKDINKPENDEIAKEILDQIDDPRLIIDAFEKLNIDRPATNKLGDITDPTFMFPESNDSNYFNNLNDASLHLAVCGAQGFEDLSQFGAMLESFETISDDTSGINDNVMAADPMEMYDLKAELSPTSEYNGDGDLTIADFIGTAAGYGHSERTKDLKLLMDEVAASPMSAMLNEINGIMTDTLSGTNTSGSNINISPTTSGAGYLPIRSEYTFGTYTSLDDAVLAIVGAIGSELDWIATTGGSLYGLTDKLTAIQRYWEETNSQMYKEAELREAYGISIENNQRTYDFEGGTGSQASFTLSKLPATADEIEVFVNGLRKNSRNHWSYDSDNNAVVFKAGSIPSAGQEIEIAYTNRNSPPNGSTADVWGLAAEFDNLGTATGFGKEADFLSRITSNDVAGSRIKATMIQARNRERATKAGMECPGYNRTLSDFYNENPNGVVNFVDLTGIWSDNTGRASEIYLQKQEKVNSREEYFSNRINRFGIDHQKIFNRIMQKILAQLLFYINDSIALTRLGAEIYNNPDNNIIDTNQEFPTDGFVLGPGDEIISEMLRTEGFASEIYQTDLSNGTKDYLDNMDLDLKKLMAALQNTMLANAENYLGLSRNDIASLFGVPSVSVIMLENIRDNNCF